MPTRTPRLRPFKVVGAIALALLIPATSATASPTEDLSQAATYLQAGELIRAKSLLIDLDRNEMDRDDRERAFELLTAIENRLKFANPNEISLQKSWLAIERGDIRMAERHYDAVLMADDADADQRAEASSIRQEAEIMKLELQPMIETTLEGAILDFDAGRYAESKSGFERVYDSGVELSPDQHRVLERYRQRIGELEQTRGRPFDTDFVAFGMMQPGTINDQDDPVGDDDDEEFVDLDDDAQDADDGRSDEDLFFEALQFDAQRILAEADRAFEGGAYSEALEKYTQITDAYRRYVSEADATRSADRIVEINVLLQQAGGDLLGEELNIREIVRDQALAEFENFLTESRQALSAGDTERARNLAAQARVRLTDIRNMLSEDEFNRRLGAQQALVDQIRQEEESIRIREIEERETRLAAEAQEQKRRQEQEKRDKINEALNRVRALELEQKYEEALQVVDQILFLDPQNPAGLLLKDTLRDLTIFREWDRLQREKSLSYARESVNTQELLVFPDELIEYPNDWPELSFRRGEPTAFSESAADRRVHAELDTKRIPASFTDNTLEDVMEFFAQITNLSLDIDWDSLEDIGVDRDTLVTLNLPEPMPAGVVLDRLLAKVSPDTFSRANWAVNDGILVVASDEALRQNTFVVIYDVRDLLFQIPSFRDYPRLDLDSVLNQSDGGSGGSIFQDEGEGEGDRLTKEELRDQLVEIIQTNVDFEGWRDNGGDTGIIQELNDNFIITNTARNHRSISGLLRQLREVRQIQINVETRFLIVNQDFFEQIGFDLDIIFNANNSQYRDAQEQQEIFGNLLTASSGRSSLLPTDLVPSFFPTTNQARNGAVNDFFLVDPGDAQTPPTVDLGPVEYVATAPDNTSIIPFQQNSNVISENLITSSFATEILALSPALGVAGTFLDDIQVDFLIEATQADRRSVTLTAPRLTFTNGHAANIFVTTQQAFVSDLNPIVGTNSVAFDPEVDVVNSGFTLALEGVVSADRRYVTLTVQTAVAEVVEFATAEVVAQTGGGANVSVGSEPVTGEFDLPIVQVTSISTGATIPDRGTLLIGGQRLTTEVEVESGVPVLSKIPILNRFFTNRVESKEESTLFILVKPTIIIQSEEEEKNFPGLLDSLQNGFSSNF